jgi:hypothetical protein
MGLSRIEAENPEDIDSRVHAGDDRDVLCRDEGARPLEVGCVRDGIAGQIVNCGFHNA